MTLRGRNQLDDPPMMRFEKDDGFDIMVHGRDIAYPESLSAGHTGSMRAEGLDLDASRSIDPNRENALASPTEKVEETNFEPLPLHDGIGLIQGQEKKDWIASQRYRHILQLNTDVASRFMSKDISDSSNIGDLQPSGDGRNLGIADVDASETKYPPRMDGDPGGFSPPLEEAMNMVSDTAFTTSATTSKTHVCPHPGCGRQFVRRRDLQRHEKHHSGTRLDCPYTKTGDCGSAFYREDKLKEHVRGVHQDSDSIGAGSEINAIRLHKDDDDSGTTGANSQVYRPSTISHRPEWFSRQVYEDSLTREKDEDTSASKAGEKFFIKYDGDSSVRQAREESPLNQDHDSLVRQGAENSSKRQEDEVSEVTSVKSLFSTPSLTSSETLSSFDSSQEMTGAAEEFAVIVLRDEILEPLFREAFKKVTFEKFERNFARLLRTFAGDLTQEAETINQKSAARFVRRSARTVAAFVSKQYDPDREENSDQMRRLILKSPQRQEMLERCLQQPWEHDGIPPDVLPNLGTMSKEEPEDDSGSDCSDVETSHLRNLNDVKTFLLGSSAFSNLRENLQRFLTGESTKPQQASMLDVSEHVEDEVNNDDSESDGSVNILKSKLEIPYVESANLLSKMLSAIVDMGRNVAEYLELREPPVNPEYSRIRWTCVS